MALLPRESGQFIARLSKHVKIRNVNNLSDKIFSELSAGKISPANYAEDPCHPKPSPAALNWIFLVDTLNFCFWAENGQSWEVEWRGKSHTGYFGLCAAVNKAIESGVNVTDPKVYSKWQLTDLEHMLRSTNGVRLPLINERLDCLRQAGTKLLDKFEGDFVNCVKESKQSAQHLLKLVVSEFPSYQDEADYSGERVSLYKRAQILIGDIWACFEGKDLGEFRDINTITMFADYRVPQVLVHFGVLEYSEELYKLLEKGELLSNGCKEEVEIRGCSIEAVEQVKSKVEQLIAESSQPLSCNSILIDHFLWTYRRQYRDDLESIPFHKTVCIYY